MTKLFLPAFFMLLSLNSQGQDTATLEKNIMLNAVLFDTIAFSRFDSFLDDVAKVKFKTVNVYFSGTNFPSTAAITFNGNMHLRQVLPEFYAKCAVGSRITFEKGIILLPGGSASGFKKSVYIE